MIQVMVQASNIFIPFNVFYFVLSFSSPLLITFVYLLLCSLFLSYFFQLRKVTFAYLLFFQFFNYFFQLIELTSKDIMNKRCNIVVVLPLVDNTRSLHIVMLPPHCFFVPFTTSRGCVTFLPHPTCGLVHVSMMNRYNQVNNNYIHVSRSDLVKIVMLIFTTTLCPFQLIEDIGCCKQPPLNATI